MVYAFDPSQGHSLGNFMTVRVPYEEVSKGPVGNYLAVVDYDSSNKLLYEPVDLNAREVMLQGGLTPSESDPRFHQQMVYAVASETVHRFEIGLGRRVKWGFRGAKKESHAGLLRLFPHAMLEANAYYSRELCGIVFGYFPASSEDPGRNLPNQTIFTCLSHDIIAHETTHAVLDGQRRRFMENTGIDVAAFHEAFADITALFQHFSCTEALTETLRRTGGQLYLRQLAPAVAPSPDGPVIVGQNTIANPIAELAKQFGESMGMRAALRSALGTTADPTRLDKTTEPHDRGAILVAAVFDAYFTSFQKATANLFQIARSAGTIGTNGDLHPTLVDALATQAARLANRFSRLCIRAIDYCPPVDIRFGEFLRALITSDFEFYPDDDVHDYREALIEAFRLRGIRPEGVVSLSEESLLWEGIDGTSPVCDGLQFDLLHGQTQAMQKKNAILLHAFADKHRGDFRLTKDDPISVESFHPVVRTGQGVPRVEIVTEVIQRRQTTLTKAGGDTFDFFGGATLILDSDGRVRYVVHKAASKSRVEEQREHLATQTAYVTGSEYTKPKVPAALNFGLIHRGF